MKKIVLSIVLGFIVFSFTGCGAKGPQFTHFEEAPKDLSLIYVYREDHFVGGGVTYDVNAKHSDGINQVIGHIRNDGYFYHKVTPDEIEFWAETVSKDSITIKIEANKIYCIKAGVIPGGLMANPTLDFVDISQCKKEIKETYKSIE